MNITTPIQRWPWPAVSWRSSLLVTALLAFAGLGAAVFKPEVHAEPAVRSFEQSIPNAFGDWQVVQATTFQVDPTVTRAGEKSMNQPYDDILARTYKNSRGEIVMLSLAYGREQRQDIKVHRPDVCYTAAGFNIVALRDVAMPVRTSEGADVQGRRMKAVRNARMGGYTELVSYWMRIGDQYKENPWVVRGYILREGMSGRVPDGVLVRASRIAGPADDEAAVHADLERFLTELVAAAPADARRLLVH